ncbi:MAG: hypothetical protein K1X67_26680 [Fimbriimonadaceae bacterium]|nr:hypothetical protein [Fimbriimonadaceae bacterium]
MRWSIYRQELVLFNAKHKRLRLLYEQSDADREQGNADKTEFAPYRRQLQQVLDSLRDVLEASLPRGAEVDIPRRDPNSQQAVEFKIELPEGLREGRGRDVFLKCLEYCRDEVLLPEAVSRESDSIKCINCLLEHFRRDDSPNCYDSKSDTAQNKKAFSVSGLLHLVSSLPILAHWDMPGIFSPVAKPGFEETTLLSAIRQLMLPVYAAMITAYPPQVERRGSGILTPSEKLLGYECRVRACYSESLQSNAPPMFIREGDFFDYCHVPRDIEVFLYQVYGILIDAVQKSLAGSAVSSDGPTYLYYLAYPIRTSVGRTHFWHIWLRPEEPCQGTLEQLWASWWPLHERFLDWPARHAWLAAELEQIDIAYAQGAMLRDIHGLGQIAGDIRPLANGLVCEHGHLLFPASCFCADGRRWGYSAYQLEGVALGSKWTDSELESSIACDSCRVSNGNSKTSSPSFHPIVPDMASRIQEKLLRARYSRLVDQQRFLAQQMFVAHQHVLDEQQQLVKEARRQLFDRIQKLVPLDATLQEQIESDSWKSATVIGEDEAVTLNDKKVVTAGQIASLLFGVCEDILNTNHHSRLLALFGGGAQVVISSLLELPPVKVWTHAAPAEEEARWRLPEAANLLKKKDRVVQDVVRVMQESVSEHSGCGDACKYATDLATHCSKLLSSLSGIVGDVDDNPFRVICQALDKLKRKSTDFSDGYLSSLLDGRIEIASVSGSSLFRSSLPPSVILPGCLIMDLVGDICKFKTANSAPKCYLFALPRAEPEPGAVANPWKPVLYRNFAAFAYSCDDQSDLFSRSVNVFRKLGKHLERLGGHFVLAFKNKQNAWHWKRIAGMESDSCERDEWPWSLHEQYRGDGATFVTAIKEAHDALFQSNNVVLLIVFDGWYMRDE